MAGNFEGATRGKIIRQPQLVKPAGGGLTELNIKQTGILARIYLRINASVAGVPAAPNPLGSPSIIRRVRVIANTGAVLHDYSGPQYFYGLRHLYESERTAPVTPQNDIAAIADGQSYNLDMYIPICVSLMDFTGVIVTQSNEVLVTLQVEWETDANVAGGVSVISATCTPYIEYFSVPRDPANMPRTDVLHYVLGESRTVAGAGELIFEPHTRVIYLQLAHLSGHAVAGGADNFDNIRLRVEQSNYLFDGDNQLMDLLWNLYHGYSRPPGVFAYDFMASSGLGNYGGARDRVNTMAVTSFESVLNMQGAGSLDTIRRFLSPLAGAPK